MAYDSGSATAPPVTDWVNDWDWLDDQWGANAIEIWNQVREQCPVATTERYGRAFMPVTMEAVAKVAHDTESFSSIWVSVAKPGVPRLPAPPITSDPPDHQGHRRLLLPYFSPKAVNGIADELRSFCRSLIADLAGSDRADLSAQYTQHIPVHGICLLTGLPEGDADMFRDWIYRNFQIAPREPAVRAQVAAEMREYIGAILEDRMASPRDDMLTMIANATIDGEPVDWDLKRGYVTLLIIAGIDTTWSAIGSGLWHFAQHPDEVARLVAVPDDDMLWMTGTEEVLRYYAPVTMGRKVVQQTEVAGSGANQMNGLSFEVSKAETLKDDARKEAVANARRRAELIATAAGAALGEVQTISEDTSDYQPRPMAYARAAMAEAVPVERGTATLEARVTVTWTLK